MPSAVAAAYFVSFLVLASTARIATDDVDEADVKKTDVLDESYYGFDDNPYGVVAVRVSSSATENPDADLNPDDLRPIVDRPPSGPVGGRNYRYHGRHHRGRHQHHGGPHGYGGPHGCPYGGRCAGMGRIDDAGVPYHRHHMQHRGWWWSADNATVDERLTYICERLRSWPTDTSARTDGLSPAFARFDSATRQRMRNMWNNRRNEMISCCQMETADERRRCLTDVQTARYDRVCRGEEPICPWALAAGAGSDGPNNLNTRCCEMEGSARTGCFVNGMDALRRSGYHHQYRRDQRMRRDRRH
jgi:hypothetical protein